MPDRPFRVIVYKSADRNVYYAQWTDPETGRKKTRSTGLDRQRAAERWASKLEDELNDGTAAIGPRTTWEDFRKRVVRDFLPEKRESTRGSYRTTMNAVEAILNPLLVSAVDAEAIDLFKAGLRAKGARDTTVANNLRHLKSLLRWGHRRKLLQRVPMIEMPKHTKVAAGRPITDAEFVKVLDAVPGVVGDDLAASWSYLFRGLWTSGLRIGKAALLTWDDRDRPRVDIDRDRPMRLIPGGCQKSGRDTITPVVPEFLAVLRETPAEDRRGFVFNPRAARVKGPRLLLNAMKGTVADIGRASGVRVLTERKSYVSAHDLRRSFCHRWSRRVMPQVLRVLEGVMHFCVAAA